MNPMPASRPSDVAAREAAARVSVVVPVHADRGTLPATLASVLAQEHVDVEVLVVDDGFSEELGRYLASLTDPRIRVLHETGGLSSSRNHGAEHATNELVAFVDDDDLWAPTKLAEQIAALRADPAARWCYCGAVSFIQIDGLPLVHHQPAPDPRAIRTTLLRGSAIPGGGSSVLCERALVFEVGRFRVMPAAEDWDMWIRCSASAPAASVDRPLVAYRIWEQRRASMSSDARVMERSWQGVADLHAAEAADAGVHADRAAFQAYLAHIAARNGSAWEAASRNARAALAGQPKRLTWVVPTLVAPRACARLAMRRSAREIPPSWSSEIRTWLPEALTASPPVADRAG